MGLDLRERALLEIRERAVDQIPDDEAQDRVPEELEPLVVGRPQVPLLVREGPVRQRPLEERGVAKRVADPLLQAADGFRDRAAHRQPPRKLVPEAGLEPARAFRPSGF